MPSETEREVDYCYYYYCLLLLATILYISWTLALWLSQHKTSSFHKEWERRGNSIWFILITCCVQHGNKMCFLKWQFISHFNVSWIVYQERERERVFVSWQAPSGCSAETRAEEWGWETTKSGCRTKYIWRCADSKKFLSKLILPVSLINLSFLPSCITLYSFHWRSSARFSLTFIKFYYTDTRLSSLSPTTDEEKFLLQAFLAPFLSFRHEMRFPEELGTRDAARRRWWWRIKMKSALVHQEFHDDIKEFTLRWVEEELETTEKKKKN